MMKKNNKRHIPKPSPRVTEPAHRIVSVFWAALLLLYVLAITFTPKWGTLDTNTARFFVMGVLNTVGILWIAVSGKQMNGVLRDFFRGPLVILYLILLAISLISFFQALNLSEAIINWFKTFTGLITILVFLAVFSRKDEILTYFSYGMIFLLFYDSIGVFQGIAGYINGTENSILDIKSVYGNKNIFSAAIFVKIPFALWLYHYKRNAYRILPFIALVCGMTAILFLSARAFYLGLAFLALMYAVYLIIVKNEGTGRQRWISSVGPVASMVAAILIYSFVQKVFYQEPGSKRPGKSDAIYKVTVTERMSTIASENVSDRTNIWRNSWKVFSSHPLLGVGKGNWKIAVLEYENQTSPDFIYKYKVHNDFLETACETGIPGGLAMLLFFSWAILGFGRYIWQGKTSAKVQQIWFLGAFGLSAYGVDAFFNFPSDRPEMFMYMGIFASVALLAMRTRTRPDSQNENTPSQPQRSWSVERVTILGFSLFALVSVYVFYLNFESSKWQLVVYKLYKGGKLDHPVDKVVKAFPPIPEISMLGEPIASNKAYALIHEKRYQEAIDILRRDHSSPFDSRREHFIAMAYYRQEMWDSAIVYAQQAYQIKPFLLSNVGVLCTSLEKLGRAGEAVPYVRRYINRIKDNPDGWVLAAQILWSSGDAQGTSSLMDSALIYHRGNKKVKEAQNFYHHKYKFREYQPMFDQAIQKFMSGRYGESLVILNEFISNYDDYPQAYERRAYVHFYLKKYREALKDANRALKLAEMDYSLVNLRGVCHHLLGQKDSACADFKIAMEKGKKDAKTNFDKFCATK